MNLPALTTESPQGLLAHSLSMATNSDASDESWLSTFGWAKNNPDYDAAMKLGEQWRQDVNRQSLVDMDRSDGRSEQLEGGNRSAAPGASARGACNDWFCGARWTRPTRPTRHSGLDEGIERGRF